MIPFNDDVGESQLFEVVLLVILYAFLVTATNLSQLSLHGVETGEIQPFGSGDGVVDAAELVVRVADLFGLFCWSLL